MLKATTILSLMFLLCSCEIFGWDSAGGADGDVTKSPVDSIENNKNIADLYYIDVPMNYPNTGSETPTSTASGLKILIPDLVEQPSTVVISEENALKLTKAACDQTAVTILNINVQETETTIFWQNASMSMGSLSLSKEEVSDPPLKLITCIN